MKRLLLLVALLIAPVLLAATVPNQWYGRKKYDYSYNGRTERVYVLVNQNDVSLFKREALVQIGYDGYQGADDVYLETVQLFRDGARVMNLDVYGYVGNGPIDASTNWYGECDGHSHNFYAKATLVVWWNAGRSERHGPISSTVALGCAGPPRPRQGRLTP